MTKFDRIIFWIFGIWNLLAAIAGWILILAGEATFATVLFTPINSLLAIVLIGFAITWRRWL